MNKDVKDKLLSLSMPFHTLKGLELEQPVFGANYITGKLKAEQGGIYNVKYIYKKMFFAHSLRCNEAESICKELLDHT